jgi:hypothetical protein
VLLPLHEARGPLAQADQSYVFVRVFAYANRTWKKTSDHFTYGLTTCRQKQGMRHGLRNNECKMMHDMLMQKYTIFFIEGFVKRIVNIAEEHGFIWKLQRYSNRFPFQKVRTNPKQKFSWGFFEVVFLGVHSYKAHTFDVYKKLG